jgi:hypothetical protein
MIIYMEIPTTALNIFSKAKKIPGKDPNIFR